MNVENLLKAADYIETIPERNFNMGKWWNYGWGIECGSVGCVVGHCYNHFSEERLGDIDDVDFERFCKDFFGIEYNSEIGTYLFNYLWEKIDDTPLGAAKRIRHVVENGLPGNWDYQMRLEAQLSYL